MSTKISCVGPYFLCSLESFQGGGSFEHSQHNYVLIEIFFNYSLLSYDIVSGSEITPSLFTDFRYLMKSCMDPEGDKEGPDPPH